MVAAVGEIVPGHGRVVTIADVEIGLFQVAGGEFRAYQNSCPHAGAPVCRGEVSQLPAADSGSAREVVRCPWHAWEFDLTTGECVFNPACRLRAFPVEVVDGQLVVSI